MAEKSAETVREAVGVFQDVDAFRDALDELASSGFDRAQLSLLASQETVEQKLGHAYHRVGEVEGDASVPRAAYADDHSVAEARTGAIGGLAYIGAVAAAGVVVASGGGLAAAIAGAAIAGGGGGLLGSIAAHFIGQAHADNLQAQLDKGGLLLWVRTADADDEKRALEILRKHGGHDVHIHELPVSDDPDANPLSGITIDPFLPGAKI
ncbi:MAG: hypothetical protein ACREJ0_24410 [Geminicoccaceae bacterium]